MRKTTITISFDEEKLSALKMYLEQKKLKVERLIPRISPSKPRLKNTQRLLVKL